MHVRFMNAYVAANNQKVEIKKQNNIDRTHSPNLLGGDIFAFYALGDSFGRQLGKQKTKNKRNENKRE